MFQTTLPKPSLAVVMPGGMSIMMWSSALDKTSASAGLAKEIDDVATRVGRLLEHQMPGRRHQLELSGRQRRDPGLRLGGRAQAIVGAPQHQGRNGDAMQPAGELGIALRVVANQLGKAGDLASELRIEGRVRHLRKITQRR